MHVLGLWEETGVNPRSERGTATRDLRAVRRQDWIVTIETVFLCDFLFRKHISPALLQLDYE